MAVEASPCVLVVDDDPAFRELVATILESGGYRPVDASTGEEALDAARRDRPQLVVLDIRLPGLSGYEVCHQLREQFGEALPIIFVSGERMESVDRVAGLLIGGDDYLVKPFAPDELLVRVRSLARRGSAGGSTRAPRLTSREMEILELLAAGLDQNDIAGRLYISPRTVAVHTTHIVSKLGARDRAHAVALAYREDIVATDERAARP